MGRRDVGRGDVSRVVRIVVPIVVRIVVGRAGQAGGTSGPAKPGGADRERTIRAGRGAASDLVAVGACRMTVAVARCATPTCRERRAMARPTRQGGECGRSASPRGAPAPTGDPSLSASDYRLVSRNAECLTSAPPRSRSPVRHRTGHDEPRRRPEDLIGRALAAETLDRLGSRGCFGAPALQTNGVPPRHTSGGAGPDAMVTGRHIASASRARMRRMHAAWTCA
jgi:hypothetical protein